MTTDIIDRIDQLVEDSLAAGEPEGGYEAWNTEPDPEYPRCPRCHRHWHGLPITARIASMYHWGRYDPEYEYASDTSPVLCEGSDFIGPMRPPPTYEQRKQHSDLGFGYIQIQIEGLGARAQATFTAYDQTWTPTWTFVVGGRIRPEPTPPACLQPAVAIEFGPQNWHYEMQPRPLQFPRTFRTPLEYDVWNLWRAFTAPDIPTPPRPGYDFSAWADNQTPTTGPEQHHGWNALNGARRRGTARRRNGRRTRG
jgi:hypothetical protein